MEQLIFVIQYSVTYVVTAVGELSRVRDFQLFVQRHFID